MIALEGRTPPFQGTPLDQVYDLQVSIACRERYLAAEMTRGEYTAPIRDTIAQGCAIPQKNTAEKSTKGEAKTIQGKKR